MRRPTTERTLSGLSNASSVGRARQWRAVPDEARRSPRSGATARRAGTGCRRSVAASTSTPRRRHCVDRGARTRPRRTRRRPRRSKPATCTRVMPSSRWNSASASSKVSLMSAGVSRCVATRHTAQRQRRAEPVQHQLQRRPAGPLEVVEHEQDRCAPAGIDDEVGDGVEVRDRADPGRTTARARCPRLPDRPATACAPAPRRRRRCPGRRRGRAGARARRSRDRTAAHSLPGTRRRARSRRPRRRGARTPRRGASCPRPVRRGRARRGGRCAAPRKTRPRADPIRAAGPRTGSTARCAAVPGAAR